MDRSRTRSGRSSRHIGCNPPGWVARAELRWCKNLPLSRISSVMTEEARVSESRRGSAVFRLEIADFGAFYERTYDAAYRTSLGIVRDPVLAADVTQEAYVAAYRHRHRYRGEAPSTAWLYRIVVNEALAALRQHRASSPVRDLSPWMAPDLSGGSDACW